MGPGEVLVTIASVGFVFGIPLMAIWTSHVRKLAEIKASGTKSNDNSLRAEVEALRAEVASLRDTTTKFDLSFDSQLTQLETRMERSESQNLKRYQSEETPQTQSVGR
jgi:hypothetical protein